MANVEFPQKGTPSEEVLATLRSLKSGDSDYKHGRMFSLIFNAGEDAAKVAEEA